MMTNRSDRGSAKPRGSQRYERDDVIREPACGLHQGQQPCGAARTSRTHGCTRPLLIVAQKLLRRRGRPHMDLQRPQYCTASWCRGRPRHHVKLNLVSWDRQQLIQRHLLALRVPRFLIQLEGEFPAFIRPPWRPSQQHIRPASSSQAMCEDGSRYSPAARPRSWPGRRSWTGTNARSGTRREGDR